ncbi:hypothetical protein CLG96_13640 [Sphingomonas oleivorans]|uniref:Heavy-metal-associated domain-containing protein n=2 Tax=Sphingomonas oleivorans TaxID=1735121 RepID=A0A2T5FX08_9SPHN|nr:hypothetical protein CLG96_13640 [Sphingomonas oleivorans]
MIATMMLGAGAVMAQIEGNERGVAPIDNSTNFEVGGVTVDVAARDSDSARTAGWRLAQRKGWRMLWARANGQPAEAAPGLPDSTLDSIVAGIVVEDEQIGPTRYIARLGVLFDRARAGQLLGGANNVARSAPMLVIPVMWSGATPQSFESRTEWQKAWARFRSGGSPIDYVRPHGSGVDPLILNVAQTRRPGRGWWRMLLDQYGAADIVVPVVHLRREWPGGPVTARFTALHGPDARPIASFSLRAASSEAMPRMLDEGVRRIDEAYSQALREGRLEPDPSLVIEEPVDEAAIQESMAEAPVIEAVGGLSTITVAVATPDAAALTQAEQALRGVPGVASANTTSMALGGISLIRVSFTADAATLRSLLTGRGIDVRGVSTESGPARPAASPPSVAPPPPQGQPPR